MRRKDPVSPAIYFVSFTLQQVLVPAAIFLLADAIGQLAPLLQQRYYWLYDPLKILAFVLCDFVGFGLGYGASKLPAPFREPARHIWILPLAAFLIFYTSSFFTDVHNVLAMLPLNKSVSSDQFAVILLAFPCAACCLYSIAIRAGDREVEIDHTAMH
jgi:hypothetical protein